MPGKDKNVFINDLETKIYSSIDNLLIIFFQSLVSLYLDQL